jgi:hypothetical protein
MLLPGVLPGVFGYNTQEIYFGILPTAGKQRRNTVNPPTGRPPKGGGQGESQRQRRCLGFAPAGAGAPQPLVPPID